jgi:molybdate transport system substrate-binding protein
MWETGEIGETAMNSSSLKIAMIGLAAMLVPTAADAAEIKLISSVGMRAVLNELKPQFERASEHTLAITFGTAVPLKRQIDAGESFDIVILTPAMVEDLVKQGKVATKADVAKSGIGVAIRAGAPKPDIGTPEAFKRTLLNAKSIAYSKEGQSGTAMARLIERLGIAEEMKPKTVLETRSGQTAANVVEGKAELAFTLISEILPIAGAELAGPLPAELQNYVVFTAGIAPAAKDATAAKAFIDFLKAPAALPVLKAKGMEPG